MKKMLFYAIFFSLFIQKVYSVSVDADFAKKIIAENKFFIEFINPHVSNFRNEEFFSLYKKAIELNFEANIYNLSGNYTEAYHKIIESQKNLKKLYFEILTKQYELDTDNLLKVSGPLILVAHDMQAEYYLKSGYTYLAKGVEIRKMGYNTNHYMNSKKIKYYMEALNSLIQAKKYAIMAIVECSTPVVDKKAYKKQSIDVALKKIEFVEIDDYSFLKNELVNNVNKKSIPSDYPFLLHHNDDYSQIDESKKSILNEISETMNSRVKSFKSDKVPEKTENISAEQRSEPMIDKSGDNSTEKKEGANGKNPQNTQ
ncbi:MAG: hypothetical protein OEV66_02180 [Spirochaetia bacterium]|nr:hypothetical protein [Spirochaetia bacterium]